MKSLLELTPDIGGSSPKRLQNLFVQLEAMSPSEIKSKGERLRMWYGVHETPFGKCLIATTSRGICNLHFLEPTGEETAEYALRREWKNAEITREQQRTKEIGDRIFASGFTPNKSLVLFVKGTHFQLQVWRALLNIPFGGLTTYQGLAAAIGRPTAARAVGNALGSNPVGYLIPCHRVIRASGELGSYRWGWERKRALIAWEASRNPTLD